MVTVTATARLHFGFGNLSLAHERLYGGIGVSLAEPRVAVDATPAEDVVCEDEAFERLVRQAVVLLDVEGAQVTVSEAFDRHVGLGSGTQFALATLVAIAEAHDKEIDPRALAPDVGRGGRSGVGVATFEGGGFVVDAGHPTERFTADRPKDGTWTVPAVAAHHDVPEDWRFVLAVPDVEAGRSGDEEDASMRAVVREAEPSIAAEVGTLVLHRLLPALVEGDRPAFGSAVAELGRLNGVWYAEEQGGLYRPPIGALVDELSERSAVDGVGQSSWGPTVYGVTDVERAAAAAAAARDAMDAAGLDGDVTVAEPRNEGATLTVDTDG